MWTDRWMDKRTKNGQTNGRNYTNFERNLAMMVIYLPVKFENVDGQTDGHRTHQSNSRVGYMQPA